MCLPGQEEMQDVSQKARYTVRAGCAEVNPMMIFLR